LIESRLTKNEGGRKGRKEMGQRERERERERE
jgi:hypothetical protein